VVRPESSGFWADHFACRKFGIGAELNVAYYFGLVRLSWVSSAATHRLGVIPRVCRNSATKALGCLYPTSAATVFTERPATSNSIPFIRRTCLLQNSKLIPTSLRKVLWIVLTLTPTSLHSASSDGASAWFAMNASATPSALESSGSLTNVGTGEAFRN
jgi:hypothetical protein